MPPDRGLADHGVRAAADAAARRAASSRAEPAEGVAVDGEQDRSVAAVLDAAGVSRWIVDWIPASDSSA